MPFKRLCSSEGEKNNILVGCLLKQYTPFMSFNNSLDRFEELGVKYSENKEYKFGELFQSFEF